MFTEIEERVLMERTAAGDRSAFRSLFDVYYPVVHGFMSSILPTREDASDVAQEVFIKLWLMRAALPDITSLRFYLYRMSLNQTINFMKKDRFRNSSVLADIPYDQMVEEVIDMKDKEAFIASVVERMPEQRRKVFVMSRFENRSNDEIASILNIKKKTVENHLNLALKELRTALPASLFLFIAFFNIPFRISAFRCYIVNNGLNLFDIGVDLWETRLYILPGPI